MDAPQWRTPRPLPSSTVGRRHPHAETLLSTIGPLLSTRIEHPQSLDPLHSMTFLQDNFAEWYSPFSSFATPCDNPQIITAANAEAIRIPAEQIFPNKDCQPGLIDQQLPCSGSTQESVPITRRTSQLKPNLQSKADPPTYYSSFPAEPTTLEGQPARQRQKRAPYAQRTCLRCQSFKQKCSGTFPCSMCLKHWDVMARTSEETFYWKECFDSDIRELNSLLSRTTFMCEVNTFAQDEASFASRIRDLKNLQQPPKQLLAITQAANYIERIVLDLSVEAGIATLHGPCAFDAAQSAAKTLEVESFSQDLTPLALWPASWIGPTHARDTSGAWLLAVIHIVPQFVCQIACLTFDQLLEARIWLIDERFEIIASMIIKVKSGTISPSQRLILHDSLSAIMMLNGAKAYNYSYIEEMRCAIYTGSSAPTVGRDWIHSVLRRHTAHLEETIIQQQHLDLYCQYWTSKVFDPGNSYMYRALPFYIAVLCRTDLNAKPRPHQHPANLAMQFLDCFGPGFLPPDYMHRLNTLARQREDACTLDWRKFLLAANIAPAGSSD